MNFFALSALINFITTATLCVIMLVKDKRSKLDVTFAAFSLSIAIWSAGYFFWQRADIAFEAIIWTHVLMAGTIMIGLTYLRFVVEFLDLTETKKHILRLSEYVFGALFILNAVSPAIVKGVEQRLQFPFWPIPGWAFHVFLVAWVASVFYSSWLLYKTYRISEGVRKKQILLLFLGLVIGLIAGSFNYLLWYNIPVPPVTNVLVSVYSVLVFYSIARYRFLNSKLIATELFVLLLLGFSIWQFFTPGGGESLLLAGFFVVLVITASIFLVRSVMKEVSQREQLQELTKQLEAANNQLKALDQARADFITIASHQLRTPPATLKWYLSAIKSGDYGKMDDGVRDVLIKAEVTNNSQISTIDDLLNASRIERGKMEFLFEETNVEEITQMTVDQLAPLAAMKKLKMTYNKPKVALPHVMADREKLRQVINNFIDNSIKYTPTGEVVVTLEQKGDDIHLEVKDTGKGMSPDVQNTVFEKYTRGKDSVTHATGLGLGLYVAQVIVKQHKGKIWAESPGVGQGSSFHFSVPIHDGVKGTSTYDLTNLASQDAVQRVPLTNAAEKISETN